jgi:ABC-type sulfate/molybdate transport systems ATPase subunit
MLEARIVKRRRDFTVDIEMHVEAGGCLALFGPSGSGKSTILSAIAGIEQPDAGAIRLGGLQLFPPPLPLDRRPIGYLTQEPHLFPHLTVARNVAFGLGAPRAQRSPREIAWLDRLRVSLGLANEWNAPASRISGGQARRVALARMLARRPPLVMLDEPFTGLDRRLVRELIEALLAWKSEIGFAMVVVDHQSEVLERLCPSAMVLVRGKIVQQGAWREIRANPVDAEVRELLRPL